MIIMILWALVVVAAAISQWYIIEKLNRFPKKNLWFIARVIVAALFMWLFVWQGYIWYWSLCYLVFAFWLPFNIIINILRGSDIFYLSPENSLVDRMLVNIFQVPMMIYLIGLVAMISSIGIMIFYGRCTWGDIAYGWC